MLHSITQHAIQGATLNALLPYILLALGLIGSITLFLSMKRELRSQGAAHHAEVEELAHKISQARQRSEPLPIEPAFVPVCTHTAPRSGLNVNKRVQAMRMVRRKEDVSHIAAALGVTRREIELLIRVQGLGAVRAASN